RHSATALFLRYLPQMATMIIPLLYIVHLNRGSFRELGLLRPRLLDPLVAIPVLVVALVFAYASAIALYSFRSSYSQATAARLDGAFPHGHTPLDILSIIFACLAIGFGEELLFRGYVLTRWQKISGSAPQAVLVSSLLFSLSHTYQGLAGMVSSAAVGVAFALAFLTLRRLWPIAIAHALMDILFFLAR
ncbi:MAG TPA: CPBP family intramembrane glutamic endopeptidase, partial [Phycisphaerae bacterium]|nr:CPBP family intramembrane glutamic endopeptidase [Phycisphaerae bacterium]